MISIINHYKFFVFDPYICSRKIQKNGTSSLESSRDQNKRATEMCFAYIAGGFITTKEIFDTRTCCLAIKPLLLLQRVSPQRNYSYN